MKHAHQLRAVERRAGRQGVQLARVQARAREQPLGREALARHGEHGIGRVDAGEAPVRHVEAGVGHQLGTRAQPDVEQRRRVPAVELRGQRADAELVGRLNAGEADRGLGVVMGRAVGAEARHDVVVARVRRVLTFHDVPSRGPRGAGGRPELCPETNWRG